MRREIEPDDAVTEVIVRAVAEVTGQDPTSMRPFTQAVDADAVETLFDRAADDGRLSLSVAYEGCRVTVTNEAVTVERQVEA